MSPRAAARLAWTLWGLSVGVVVLSVPLTVLNGFEPSFDRVFGVVTAWVFPTVGAVIASRRTLNGDLLRVVRETMQPEHASLWLRPAGGGARPGEERG